MKKAKRCIVIITVINLIILILLAFCMLRITEMHRAINAAGDEFQYTETESGEVHLDLGDHGIATMRFGKDGVSIREAHLFDNPDCLPKVLRFVRYYVAREGYDIPRTNVELIGEYRLQTILFELGYKPEQTETLNWDFCEDPRWYVNTASSIIGWCGI